jgi:hypothetical protein
MIHSVQSDSTTPVFPSKLVFTNLGTHEPVGEEHASAVEVDTNETVGPTFANFELTATSR